MTPGRRNLYLCFLYLGRFILFVVAVVVGVPISFFCIGMLGVLWPFLSQPVFILGFIVLLFAIFLMSWARGGYREWNGPRQRSTPPPLPRPPVPLPPDIMEQCRKLELLRAMTVLNGCTIPEAAAAKRKARSLEVSLSEWAKANGYS